MPRRLRKGIKWSEEARLRVWSQGRESRLSQQANELIETAKKIVEGKASVYRLRGKARGRRTPQEKIYAVIQKIKKNPFETDSSIVHSQKVSGATTRRLRSMLVDKGVVSEISRSERSKISLRKPENATNFFSQRGIKKIIEQNKERIQKTANYFYYSNRIAFDSAGILPETITDEISERLAWKLKTFDPGRIKGPEKTKRFLSYEITHIGMDLRRKALKKYEKAKQYKKDQIFEQKQKMQQIIKGRTMQEIDFSKFTIERIEEISRNLDLNVIEKAVLFGLAAGMQQKQIGKELSLHESRISQIRAKLFPRVKQVIELLP